VCTHVSLVSDITTLHFSPLFVYCLLSFKYFVLLTVHPSMILVNNQPDAKFFMYVYFCSLHVSGSHVPIIRRIVVSIRHLVYATLCRWPPGMQVRLRIEINILEKLCVKLVIHKDRLSMYFSVGHMCIYYITQVMIYRELS